MTTPDILLLQPRHIYAPHPEKHEIGHVYMPTSLITAAARLVSAGARVRLHDENLSQSLLKCDALGINLVGAPYVDTARALAVRLRSASPKAALAFGGQVTAGFSPSEFQQLFGTDTANGNEDRALARFAGVDVRVLPRPEHTSLIDAYELIPDRDMRTYLTSEFAFFLSFGCKFSCTFCAAYRSGRDPKSGRLRRVKEMYRRLERVEKDLKYLIERACRLGIGALKIYLTNLDLFQTPARLGEFAQVSSSLLKSYPGFRLEMRGLSTVHSFLAAHESLPHVIASCVEAGISRIGFGVDGATARVFKVTRKPQRTSMCEKAIDIARTMYGIVPETLMVFGHSGIDTEESLKRARDFTKAMWDKYGSIPRPHVAKDVVPGNDGWYSPASRRVVSTLLAEPALFQVLDFTALPSALTHPDAQLRKLVATYYKDVCQFEGSVTRYVLPEHQETGGSGLAEIRAFNEGRYDI